MTKANKQRQKSAKVKTENEDRLTVPYPLPGPSPIGPTFPFPWPLPSMSESPWMPSPQPTHRVEGADRSVTDGQFEMVANNWEELLKRIYSRPDYQHVINLYVQQLEKAFAEKPEAMEQLMEMFPQEENGEDDRILPALVYGGVFLVSAGLGYAAAQK